MRRSILLGLLAVALALLLWRYEAGRELEGPAPAPGETAQPAVPPSTADGSNATAVVKTVRVSSGIPIKLIRRHRIAVPDPPYGPAFDKLYPAAKAGDTVAQYRLGLLLYECRDVPVEQAALDQQIESVYQTRKRDGWDVDDPADEAQTMRRRFEECAGVPGDERGRYRDWMKHAADAGLLDAQLDLPLHLPPGQYCQYLSECSPEQRAKQEALQAEAVDYLGRARDNGSVTALWTFGAWYAEGDVLPQNYVEAYADFSALDQVYTAAGEGNRFKAMLADLRGHLRPVDIEQANARAKQLLSNPNCCVLTP